MTAKLAFRSLIVALALGLAFGAWAKDKKDKKVIAIGKPTTDWRSSGACRGYAPTYANSLAKSLRSRIAETGVFRVVSRRQMGKILKEHEMAMTGITDPDRVKELGKLLQADFLMGVDLICHTKTVEMNVSLWDTETGESAWTKVYEMKNLNKTSRALKDVAKLMKKYGKTGSFGDSTRHELFQIVDSKAFHDSTEYIVDRIRYTIPRARGTVEEINVYGETLKVKISYGGFKPWAGLKLKVTRDDEELGWVFLKKKGRGVIEAGTNDDMSTFEEGDQISSQDFEPKVAIGFIEDVDEGQDEMVGKFKERMYEIMQEAEGVEAAEGKKIEKILQRMGTKTRKKDLAKLHKAGVDLLIVGRFLGENGQRRLDFEVLSTYDGKRVIDIKRDRIGL